MTGLDLGRDALIEVAALVTDPDLNVLGDGVDVVIHAGDDLLDGMFDVVREMHDRSELAVAKNALDGPPFGKIDFVEAELVEFA